MSLLCGSVQREVKYTVHIYTSPEIFLEKRKSQDLYTCRWELNPQTSHHHNSGVTALPVELPSPWEQGGGELGICTYVASVLLHYYWLQVLGHSTEKLLLRAVIPVVHMAIWNLVLALVNACGSYLLPYATHIEFNLMRGMSLTSRQLKK